MLAFHLLGQQVPLFVEHLTVLHVLHNLKLFHFATAHFKRRIELDRVKLLKDCSERLQ